MILSGDNLDVMRKRIADASIDLIYADPPFASDRDYVDFDDRWGGIDGYLDFMKPRMSEMHRVLKPTGSIYLHCDPTASHYLKLVMDAIFGLRNFRGEVIWHYETSGGAPKKWMNKNHDVLLAYAKDIKQATWHHIRAEWPESTLKKWQTDEDGRVYRTNNGKRYYIHPDGKMCDDVWEITFASRDKERLGYPTQKPRKLLERIIESSSNPGDVILDPFCGCGTASEAAQKLGREYICIDSSPRAIVLTRRRLGVADIAAARVSSRARQELKVCQ